MTTPQEEHEQVLQLAGELRILVGKLRRRLREEAHLGDVSMSQASVLSRLERDGPATASSLARRRHAAPIDGRHRASLDASADGDGLARIRSMAGRRC